LDTLSTTASGFCGFILSFESIFRLNVFLFQRTNFSVGVITDFESGDLRDIKPMFLPEDKSVEPNLEVRLF
jgi:hypothetical protein